MLPPIYLTLENFCCDISEAVSPTTQSPPIMQKGISGGGVGVGDPHYLLGGVSLHLASFPTEFSCGCKFDDGACINGNEFVA